MVRADTLIKITCFALLSEVLYHIFNKVYDKLTRKSVSLDGLTGSLIQQYNGENSKEQLDFHKVIFFPDAGVACKREQAGRICRDKKCGFFHGQTSLGVLVKVLGLVRSKLDICVFVITSNPLANIIVECHKKGILVRVITDERNTGEDGEFAGAQIGKLREAGIPVRCRESSFWMHHKFVVADDEILVNGSFNWTNQAAMGNFENLIITSEPKLVKPFSTEFERLWEKLAPNIASIE